TGISRVEQPLTWWFHVPETNRQRPAHCRAPEDTFRLAAASRKWQSDPITASRENTHDTARRRDPVLPPDRHTPGRNRPAGAGRGPPHLDGLPDDPASGAVRLDGVSPLPPATAEEEARCQRNSRSPRPAVRDCVRPCSATCKPPDA